MTLPRERSLGPIAILGSGETSSSGGRVLESLARGLPSPLRVSVLETPAGFEPNSAQVAGRVADFLRLRLQNSHPEVDLIPARKRNSPFSPDDPEIVRPLLRSDLIFLGPGSPTYAVRQLRDSLAWHTLLARHRLGAAIVLSSAAALAVSALALPVYEIYKVGQDLHWHDGLDLLGFFGLSLVFIPHWNNAEGGSDLDTSRCFMGQERFVQLGSLLPAQMTVVGIDEHTALVFDLTAATCQVMGAGGVTVIRSGQEYGLGSGETFSLKELGPFQRPDSGAGIPLAVWEQVQAAQSPPVLAAPPEVLALVAQRRAARARRDWAAADALRQHIASLGWQVMDTPSGPVLEPVVPALN